jgi:hypothetical protein
LPVCTRCGHPRREHRGQFGGARETGCRSRVAIEGTLAVGRCACPGFTADPNEELTAAVIEVRVPRLRIADQPTTVVEPTFTSAAKDLFDLQPPADPTPWWPQT